MTDNEKKVVKIFSYIFFTTLAYLLVAFWVFQWRNPKANEMTFYSELFGVITWQKMEKYQ